MAVLSALVLLEEEEEVRVCVCVGGGEVKTFYCIKFRAHAFITWISLSRSAPCPATRMMQIIIAPLRTCRVVFGISEFSPFWISVSTQFGNSKLEVRAIQYFQDSDNKKFGNSKLEKCAILIGKESEVVIVKGSKVTRCSNKNGGENGRFSKGDAKAVGIQGWRKYRFCGQQALQVRNSAVQ